METNDGSLDYARESEEETIKPTSHSRKRELEEMLGFEICPLTVEEVDEPLFMGLYMNAGPVHKYKCSVDGGVARGGTPSTIMFFTAIRPCPLEYAKTCNLYKGRTGETTFKNSE